MASELTGTLLLTVIVASLGTWFPLGYNIVSMNGPQSVIVNWIRTVRCNRLTDKESTLWCKPIPEQEASQILAQNPQLNTLWAIASSFMCFGGLVSTFGCATLMNRYGPRKSLFITGGVLIVGVVIFSLSPLARAYEMLIVGRFVIGLAMGMISAITPVYTYELAPVSLRGAMGTIPVIMSVLGMGVGTFLGLPYLLGSGTDWAILVALQLIPVLIMLLVLLKCPESPSYLYLVQQKTSEAEKALIWLRRTTDVQRELLVLEMELKESIYRRRVSIFGIFKQKLLRSTLLIAAVPLFAQHFAGYGCVTMYSTAIFSGTGMSQVASIYASLGLWATYLIFALGSMVLVDRMGRRVLLLISQASIIGSFCALVMFMALTKHGRSWSKYGSLASLFGFIASYAVGLASIPWMLPSELFTQDARAAGMTLVCVVSWASVLVTSFVFSVIVPYAEEYTFLVFIIFTFFTAVFVYLKLPETKGKSVDEIQTVLRARCLDEVRNA